MIKRRSFLKIFTAASTGSLLLSPQLIAVKGQKHLVLKNKLIKLNFEKTGSIWINTEISRLDNSDLLKLDNDEFEILLFDKSRFYGRDYEISEEPEITKKESKQTVKFTYIRKKSTSNKAPEKVEVTYEMTDKPYFHKRIFIHMNKGDKIDRLQAWRFSTAHKAAMGGFGQPVNINNWFFGMDYPAFYSRHSDGFKEPDHYYRWFYDIDLDEGDKEYKPRKGLVSLFHFPGYAEKQENEEWGIMSKHAVAGLSSHKGKNADLALFEYISDTRKPPRSHLHFNNWYSQEAKSITIKDFVNGFYLKLKEKFKKYEVKLDAMVPDHGWEDSKAYKKIFDQSPKHDLLPEVAKALEKNGTKLGAWMAFDGTNQNIKHGVEKIGYRSAYRKDFKREKRWMQGKEYFDILDPKYLEDLKKSLHYLIVDSHVDYIKHDFNHNFTSHYITQRHAREKCLNTTLELLQYERELNPGIYQNYTNGAWFSPWWLQKVECIWMMSGDSGGGGAWPELSLRDGATTYRDKYFFQSFNNPDRCPRPMLPIANFMTHGILFAKKKPFTDGTDTLHDWANYVVMYYARGTVLKELYLTLEFLNDDHWKILGMATNWAVKNQNQLINTVLIGGNVEKGEVYGYISWANGKAILSVRNPDRREQKLKVPFDQSVYFREEKGQQYHAGAIYPYVEEMPWNIRSGESFNVIVPGDSVVVYEINKGAPENSEEIKPKPLPNFSAEADKKEFQLKIQVPDEKFKRYDLMIVAKAVASAKLEINRKKVKNDRFNSGKRWGLTTFDLREYKGKELKIKGIMAAEKGAKLNSNKEVKIDVWLVVDRTVNPKPVKQDKNLPFPISQNFRRITQQLIVNKPIKPDHIVDKKRSSK